MKDMLIDLCYLAAAYSLIITIVWQQLEVKITGERTHRFKDDVIAFVLSIGAAALTLYYKAILFVDLWITFVSVLLNVYLIVWVIMKLIESIYLAKINNELNKQIEIYEEIIENYQKRLEK